MVNCFNELLLKRNLGKSGKDVYLLEGCYDSRGYVFFFSFLANFWVRAFFFCWLLFSNFRSPIFKGGEFFVITCRFFFNQIENIDTFLLTLNSFSSRVLALPNRV